jgi:AcrR family transcriptional regulator
VRKEQPRWAREGWYRNLTRERILEAAEQLFLERGYRATSVQDIAAAAGFTTGALYSSFKSKDDLFLAVADWRGDQNQEVLRNVLAAKKTSADAATAIGDALQALLPEPAWLAVFYEFASYAARDQELRRELTTRFAALPATLEEVLGEVSATSPLPVHRLATIVAALMQGLAGMWFAEPESVDPTLVSDAVALLLGTPPKRT